MTRFYTQGPQEPEQSPSEIHVARKVVPTKQPAGDPESPAMQSIFTTKPTVPPTHEDQGGLRLKAFTSRLVDNLPTVAMPTPPDAGQKYEGIEHLATATLPATNGLSSSGTNLDRRSGSGSSAISTQQQDPYMAGSRQPEVMRRKLHGPEIENGHVILYRASNFYVRTSNRRGQQSNPLRKRSGHTALVPKVVPEQEQRIAFSTTRMMPQVSAINPMKQGYPVPLWVEAIFVAIGLLGALATHAFNLFSFPHYELDEGTYMSSAWAILHGMIYPYPYGYGHPPAGWIQIAAWIQLTGGFFTFGNALNSGRVLMLLYALASSLLVYLVTRRLLGSRTTALLAMVIFSLSPLSIVFQRQVFLDNIGTFWLLLALYLIVISNSRLLYIVGAALSFGISILSKEIFVLFIPVMIYALWLHTTRFQRKFALVAFIYSIIAIGSSFVLMALLKGELLPAGVLPWDHHPHLSMLDTFTQQAQRSQSEGSISVSWTEWAGSDMLLMALSIGATLLNLILGWWNRKLLLLALLAITFWVLLVRGGVVFPFYIIPLIPLVAFNAAAAINAILQLIGRVTRFDLVRVVLLCCVIVAIVSYDIKQASGYVNQTPAKAQTDALSWIHNHIPQNSVLVINSYFYTDLHEEGGAGVGNGTIYPYAHIYWNVAYDPELHDGLLKGDWNRIDYIVTDTTMLFDIKDRGGNMAIIGDALNHAVLQADFQAQDRDQHIDIQIYQVIHRQNNPLVYQGGIPPIDISNRRRNI
jgi:4-amino-4-deoxy-L-arabinose transferase-like glycosyltransferase